MRRDLRGPEHAKREGMAKRELAGKTPEELDAWVDATATTFAGVRRVLKLLLRIALSTRQ